jgi:hypothetical protein
MAEAKYVGRDTTGALYISDGMLFYVTDCCGGSAKGSANVATGVVCRACYTEVDPMLGMAWTGTEALTKIAEVLP